jgi:hypothetical protein
MLTSTPLFFIALIERFFQMPRKFAVKLWPCVEATSMLLWQMSLCDSMPADTAVWLSRVKRLSEVLTPTMLLQASLRLSPEGKRRDAQCVQFEEAVLQALDRSGNWKW